MSSVIDPTPLAQVRTVVGVVLLLAYGYLRIMSSDNETTIDTQEEQSQNSEQLPPGFEPDFEEDDCYQPDGVQTIEVRGLGMAAAELVNFGDVFDAGMRGGQETRVTPEKIASIIAEHYVSPSYDGLTGDKVRQMKPTVPGALLDAIMDDETVDVEMQPDGSAVINVDEGGNSQ